jgi:hypothetical protein
MFYLIGELNDDRITEKDEHIVETSLGNTCQSSIESVGSSTGNFHFLTFLLVCLMTP